MPRMTFISWGGIRKEVTSDRNTTVMRLAQENNVVGIIGSCGGSLSCATCHVYIDDGWLDSIPRPSEEEEFMLEYAKDARPGSRLSCQILLTDELDGLVVRLPESQA